MNSSSSNSDNLLEQVKVLDQRQFEIRKIHIDYRLKNHHAYVTRQWLYFVSFITLNGLAANLIKDLSNQADIQKFVLVGFVLIVVSTVFVHLIIYTHIRIHTNATSLSKLTGEAIIQLPTPDEGIAYWLLLSITVSTIMWLILIFQLSYHGLGIIAAFWYLAVTISRLHMVEKTLKYGWWTFKRFFDGPLDKKKSSYLNDVLWALNRAIIFMLLLMLGCLIGISAIIQVREHLSVISATASYFGPWIAISTLMMTFMLLVLLTLRWRDKK
jgi:uncharacterized membrane protein